MVTSIHEYPEVLRLRTEVLGDLVVKLHKYKPFLTAGSLLHAVRDKEFSTNDSDHDIGISILNVDNDFLSTVSVVNTLINNNYGVRTFGNQYENFRSVNVWPLQEDRDAVYSLDDMTTAQKVRNKRAWCDIEFYYPMKLPDRYVWALPCNKSIYIWEKEILHNDKVSITQLKDGSWWPILQTSTDYLDQLYSVWEVPTPSWKWINKLPSKLYPTTYRYVGYVEKYKDYFWIQDDIVYKYSDFMES